MIRSGPRTALQAGFTLIELLAVTAIMVVITGLVLANNNRFNGTILLQNLTYDIALAVREAQVYGISVQNFNGSFESPYGMHFSTSGNTSIYVLFVDKNGDGLYTDGTEAVQTTTLAGNYRISDLCSTPATGAEVCGLSYLDVTFVRPEPDAYIRSSANPGDLNPAGKIKVSSSSGVSREVVIYANGQISVQQ